jgi:uncharacterized protein YukE
VSDVHANPDDMERFASVLKSATAEIEKQTARLNSEYRRLGASWKDRKFASFGSDFDRSISSLRSATRALEPYPPKLRRHAQALRQFLNAR